MHLAKINLFDGYISYSVFGNRHRDEIVESGKAFKSFRIYIGEL